MATDDTCVTLVPYFKVHAGKMDEARALCEKFVAKTREEPKVLFYGFSFDGDEVHCREGYEGGAGVTAHLENVGDILKAMLEISDLTRLEIHGTAEEIDPLRAPLADLKPQFFTLEYGFRR